VLLYCENLGCHAQGEGRDEGYIFAGDRLGRRLNLTNLANRIIKPAMEKEEKSRHCFFG